MSKESTSVAGNSEKKRKTALSASEWEKLLLRWTPFDPTPEVQLLVWVIARAIVDEPAEALETEREPFSQKYGFFARGFDAYCAALGLKWQFVLQQIQRANNYLQENEVTARASAS